MAVWQFVLDLIPAAEASVSGIPAVRMSAAQLGRIRPVFSELDGERLFARLDRLLPARETWASGLKIWGDDKSDDAQVAVSGSGIESAQFRLNAADLSIPLIGGICAIARELNCVLASSEGAIIQPSSEAVVRAIAQSDAARFVRDPEAFLAEAIQRDCEGQ